MTRIIKYFLYALTIYFCQLTLFVQAQSPWVTLQNFSGTPRGSGVMFIINDTVYAGTGRDTGPNGHISTNDFYKYNSSSNSWTSIASLPGDYRWLSTGFSIGNKGYVTLGAGDTTGILNEVWEYDPIVNSWNQKLNFPGPKRYGAFCFVINNKAYVGGGQPGNYNDLWEYNPISDTWIQKANFPANGRHAAISFAIQSKGYMGLGRDDTTIYNNDFWEYTPLTDSWLQKATFPDTGRYIGTGFSLNGKGYAGLGILERPTGGYVQNDFWEYNPINNNWNSISNIPGIPRDHSIAASNDSTAYILGGAEQWGGFLSDFYSISYKNLSGISEKIITDNINISSFNKIVSIENERNQPIVFKVYDLLGKLLFSKIIETGKQKIDLSFMENCIVVYQVTSKNNILKCGKLVVFD